jgi:hypothetical protein
VVLSLVKVISLLMVGYTISTHNVEIMPYTHSTVYYRRTQKMQQTLFLLLRTFPFSSREMYKMNTVS